MARKPAAPKPLSEIERLLPKITHNELLELIVCAQEEAARRAEGYCDAVLDGSATVDVLNEGVAFVTRLLDTVKTLSHNQRVVETWRDARDAERFLHEALNHA